MLTACRTSLAAIAAGLGLFIAAATAFAQPAAISGTVVDASGAPVADARLSVATTDGTTWTPVARTGSDGRFSFAMPAAPAAPSSTTQLTLRIERPPFHAEELDVRVNPGTTAGPLHLILTPQLAPEVVRVVSPLIDATTADSFGSLRTVVSEAQVLDLHALDLASALRRTPGVTISRFNPVGAFGGGDGGAVFIRGIGSSRPGSEIKTYIDEVPLYMGVWGHPLLGLLPVNGIERITVLKGPHPQTMGNTLASVNIETRRARDTGTFGQMRLSGGAFSTVAEQADAAGRMGRWDFAAAQGFARSEGHRPDADGRMANGLARLGYRPGDRWSAHVLLLHVDSVGTDPGHVGRPETRTGRYETNATLGAVTVGHQHGLVSGTLRTYGTRGDGDWFDQPAPDGDTLAHFSTTGLRWREQALAWQGGRISAGLDVDRSRAQVRFNRVAPAPQTTFDAEALTLTSPLLAVDHTVTLGRGWSLVPSAGLRYYAHSVFESATAPHAGLVVGHEASAAIRVNYARGVNYPGQEVVALSSLIPPLGDSWRSLRPERMDHLEVGLWSAPTSRTTIDVAYFHDRLTDRYVFGFPPAVPRPAFVNLGAYQVRGGELSVRQTVTARWQVFGGLTLLDPSLDTLPYAPTRSLVVGVTGRHGAFSLSADAQVQNGMFVLASARTAGARNTQQVDGFTVVNVRPAWTPPWLGGRNQVFVAIENLFDESYAYRPGYPMPGASLQVGISVGGRVR